MVFHQLVNAPETEAKQPAGADCTRQKLLRAADAAFTELGFQSATTREIARRAGVNEVTLFRHFRTRSDLVRAVISETLNAEVAFVESFHFDEHDLRKAIADYVKAYVRVVERREGVARIVVGEGHLLPKDIQDTIISVIVPLKERIADWLRRAQQNGLVRPEVDPMGAVEVLRDALHSAVLRWSTFGPVSCSRDVYLQTLIETFVRGIETCAPAKQS
ncbi:MAG: TetR/AcrR family transcriptional regulator [Verrucomicrobia bacterium]|nr:TetR/AcrR family transcriptional regulator [Verrucomicrobiota bacterium]